MKVRGSCVIDAASRNPTGESCALVSWAAPAARAASDYLLQLDGVKGESIDPAQTGAIEISSWSWGQVIRLQ